MGALSALRVSGDRNFATKLKQDVVIEIRPRAVGKARVLIVGAA
jgi:hypothetical protein